MASKPHAPISAASDLATKLAARTRHVNLFLGAGASRAAGLPDLTGLQDAVLEAIEEPHRTTLRALFAKGNLETALSYLRRLGALLEPGQKLGGITQEDALSLQARVTTAIVEALHTSKADLTAFEMLARWLAGGYYSQPIEVFTINYDLLIENGLESEGVPYFDGFVGNMRARFRPELVEQLVSHSGEALPSSFVRLWKLHGSMNWAEETAGTVRRIVRLGTPADVASTAAIYPSDEKYDESRRVPFVVLMDRLRRALSAPETITLVAGYSFADQHLNELIFDAAVANPRSETCVLCYTTIPDVVASRAASTRNITVLARTEAIVGGRRAGWHNDDEVADLWERSEFLLGDFEKLALFLSRATRGLAHAE